MTPLRPNPRRPTPLPLAPALALAAALALALAGGCGGNGGPPSGAAPPARDARPNLLFILSDDQRADALGAYGNRTVRTPNLDRIAAEGARLDRFYVTTPVCAPSRAAFLTARYGHQTGVLSNVAVRPFHAPRDLDIFGFPGADLAPGTTTIAHALAAAGYATGFVGKAHLGGDPRLWGFRDTPVWLRSAASPHESPRLMVDGEPQTVAGRHVTEIFADAAIDFVERHRDERWLLWLATTAPHSPYYVQPRHRVAPEDVEPPPHWPPGQPLGDADWAGYYATIAMLDEQLGRVFDHLRQTGLLDRTFVVFTSDNGLLHGRLGRIPIFAGKSVWFEDVVRVPALVRYPPLVPAGRVVASPVSSVDVPATLAELAGAEPMPGAQEARSLLPALAGEPPLRTAAFAEIDDPLQPYLKWQIAHDGRFKYVHFTETGNEVLYDLDSDPHERTTAAIGEPAAPDLARLRRLREEWLAATPP